MRKLLTVLTILTLAVNTAKANEPKITSDALFGSWQCALIDDPNADMKITSTDTFYQDGTVTSKGSIVFTRNQASGTEDSLINIRSKSYWKLHGKTLYFSMNTTTVETDSTSQYTKRFAADLQKMAQSQNGFSKEHVEQLTANKLLLRATNQNQLKKCTR